MAMETDLQESMMSTFTPTPWTIPRLLRAEVALGPGLQSESLRKGLERLTDRGDVRALVVFGSRAGADARSDSDLDLLVIMKEAKIPPEEQIHRWQELRSAFGDLGLPVDLLVYGEKEAAWLSESRWHVLGHAARRGKVLYVAQ
jgi:predicted nucleotidyltransferase